MQKYVIWGILLGVLVIFIDILTKSHVYHEVTPISSNIWTYPYGGKGVFENFLGVEFSVVHTTNKGAAWGSLSNFQIPLLFLRMALIFGLTSYLIFFNRNKKYIIPICLLIAGALGNVIDYFIYGEVIDMLKFVLWGYHYPIFNIADSAITIGIIWLFIASFFQHDTSTKSQ